MLASFERNGRPSGLREFGTQK
uniref:Uncharacterized protein n=1 Tax=Zea mays TaxID=4577 RepID=C4IYW4_MAIZE|nr:unknown [Zea mays]